MEWKSLHEAFIEGEIKRMQTQVRLLDRLGLPELADRADDKITTLLNKIPVRPSSERL